MRQKYQAKNFFHLPAKYLLIMIAITMLFLCSEVSANASAEDVHDVADLCMYASRSLKDYALIGMGVDYNDPKTELKETLKLADEHFKRLKSHKMNEQLTTEILEMETSWSTLKPAFKETPDKAKMQDLHHQVELYTNHCEEVVEDLSKDTGIKGEHYVVLVAQLGMESQRMACEYLTKAWGVEDAEYDKQVKHMLEEIEGIFKELIDADVKLVSQEIKDKLKEVENDFTAFGVMLKSTSGRMMPSSAEKSASKIYERVLVILHMEEKLVENSISGYFLPIATEENTNMLFEIISEILQVEEKFVS
ncbi:MAG: hypothetical protein D3923_09445 [Candidatus Electrothrix sp. AR3]|nr:hypothetical protein [Candidatus Electrothrix sp. AR3]